MIYKTPGECLTTGGHVYYHDVCTNCCGVRGKDGSTSPSEAPVSHVEPRNDESGPEVANTENKSRVRLLRGRHVDDLLAYPDLKVDAIPIDEEQDIACDECLEMLSFPTNTEFALCYLPDGHPGDHMATGMDWWGRTQWFLSWRKAED